MPWARLRESGSALIGVAAAVALFSAVGVGAVAYLSHEGTSGVRQELATRVGSDLALQASLDPVANSEAQDAQVRAAIATSLDRTGIRFDVTRTLSADVRVEPDSDKVGVEPAVVMSIADLDARADLVSGGFPEHETEVAVQADAAAKLGLAPGDKVVLEGATFVVVGTWRATDYLDPTWYGDPMVATGFDDAYGPFVISEPAWSRLDTAPKVRWTVVPSDLHDITSTNIGAVITSWSRIQADWRGQVDRLEGFGFQRGLSQTLAGLETRLDGQRAIEPVILTLLGALGLVTVFELIALLAGIRASESYLQWSRGRAPIRIALRSAVDVAGAAVIGAAIGCAAAVALGLVVGFSDALLPLALTLAVIPLAAVAVCAALAVVSSLRSLRGMTQRSRGGRRDARAARRVAVPGAIVLVALGAGIAVWQLRLYGSAVIVAPGGGTSVDPVAVAAPAAALLALVLLSAALLPWLARRGERATRRRSIPTTLAARSLALHSARFTAPLVVVALAVGGMTVAAAYSSTWASSYEGAAALRAGADVLVSSTDQLDPDSQAAVRDAVGPGEVAPLSRQALLLGSVSGSIVAASPQALTTLASPAGGLFDGAAVADDISIRPPGPVVPVGTTELVVTVSTSYLLSPPSMSAHVVDPLGFTTVVDFGAPTGSIDNSKGTFVYTAQLGGLAASESLTVLAMDFGFSNGSFAQATAAVHLTSLATGPAGSEVLDLGPFWIPGNPGDEAELPSGDGTGLGLVLTSDSASARLVPSLDGTLYERLHLPVVVSQSLASLVGIGVGDTLSFTLADGVERINWDVKAVVPAIPAASVEAAVMVDLAVVQHYQLLATAVPPEPRDLWLRTDSPSDLRAVIRPLLPAAAHVDTLEDPAALAILGSPRLVLWAAAIGSVLLALIAAASSMRARGRWGRTDVAALRALGLGARDQRRVPIREFTAVIAVGILWGLIAGGAVALLTVAQIARAAIPERYRAIGNAVSWDVPALAALLGVLVLGLVVLVLGLARATTRLARTAIPQGGAG
ncbi:hypothetical protein BH11ACT5_BH11ACT5_10070 [soil metagenome]